MANILTATEASTVLRCTVSDADMLVLLPLVDAYIKQASGRDWSQESPIPNEAKSAARMLLVCWHENPSMVSNENASLGFGLTSCLLHLEVLALRYHEFYGRNGASAVNLPGVERGDMVDSLIAIVGDDGDQSNAFESFVTIDDEIQQVSTSDLSEVMFRVKVIPPEEL